MTKIELDGSRILDNNGRELFLRGINFAAEAKFPLNGSDSFVGSPCPLDEADAHLERLRRLGFNTIRYIYTWDALEHEGPDQYDEAYIDYVIAMVKKANDLGFYVFMDPHQDVWSRFSGGSGAPLWTLYAAGFNPDQFEDTHAAKLYKKDEAKPVKMLWSSNYARLVSQTMFTLFFGGEQFAPNSKINGVGVGTYLKTQYFKAIRHFIDRVQKSEAEVIGWESMNEPAHGYIGTADLAELGDSPTLVKLTTAPTPFQGMLLGAGVSQSIEFYRFTPMGFRKYPNVQVTPQKPVWFSKQEQQQIDAKYGWSRNWYGCIWRHHGVYEGQRLLKPDYFYSGGTDSFVQHYFTSHFQEFLELVRSFSAEWIVFMQAPVNLPPPEYVDKFKSSDRVIYTPHYYDGLTLMLKRWMWMNVDAVGVCRQLYSTPVRAVKIGPRAIRSGFSQQLSYIKEEGIKRVGKIPCLVSEIGIPYDMDNKRSYQTGLFHDQIQAMDANNYGLESSKLSHALWVYSCNNTNQYGDMWCGEDLSIWSKDQCSPAIDNSDPDNYDDGVRAAAAVIRPEPIAVNGKIGAFNFDIYRAAFEIEIEGSDRDQVTTLYIPSYYFGKDPSTIHVSSGSYTLKDQVLYWNHGKGRQTMRIKGTPRFNDTLYYYTDHIVKTLNMAKSGIWGLFKRRNEVVT